jgi:hypothetical protein
VAFSHGGDGVSGLLEQSELAVRHAIGRESANHLFPSFRGKLTASLMNATQQAFASLNNCQLNNGALRPGLAPRRIVLGCPDPPRLG